MRISFTRGVDAHTQGQAAFDGEAITDIRLASGRELPAGTEVRVSDVGRPDAVGARIRLPGGLELIDLGNVPCVDGVVLLPDDKVLLAKGTLRVRDSLA